MYENLSIENACMSATGLFSLSQRIAARASRSNEIEPNAGIRDMTRSYHNLDILVHVEEA